MAGSTGGPWRTAISHSDADSIHIGGYDLTSMMPAVTFTDVIFLLHRGELPTPAERRLLDAMLIAASDHGPGSPSAMAARVAATGNRRGLEAAVAAGILAIGDAHGGAGYACMELIAEGVRLVHDERCSPDDAARRIVDGAMERGERLPGLGHRTHDEDPRTTALLALAHDLGVVGEGVALIEAFQRAVADRIKPLPINIDGSSAAVLFDMGFPPQAAKLIFILGRAAGLTAQVWEELSRERPMRARVTIDYDGPAPRPLPSSR